MQGARKTLMVAAHTVHALGMSASSKDGQNGEQTPTVKTPQNNSN
jgi:hypothetical protein